MTKLQHAKLSASGSHRWMRCPGSMNAEDGYPDTSSVFAEEGTRAHELADRCLSSYTDAAFYIDNPNYDSLVTKDMADYVQVYLDTVRWYESADSKRTILLTEQKVDFSHVVPDGFGTMDSAVIDLKERTAHIFDLKYGKGIAVDATENSQGLLYAIGLLHDYSDSYDIKEVFIHIVQPRLYSHTIWKLSKDDIDERAKEIHIKALACLNPDAPRVPSEEACRFCKAKADCKALADHAITAMGTEFDNLDQLTSESLSDAQRKSILDNKKLILSFLNAVEAQAKYTLEVGGYVEGYKLVEGSPRATWTQYAVDELPNFLGDAAFNKQLISITDAKKILDKSTIDGLTYKKEMPRVLVKNSDKREGVNFTSIFDDLDD